MSPDTVIVVPTIRQTCIRAFLDAWRSALKDCRILVIEDNPARSFDLADYSNVSHYCWEDIDADLGERSWIVPRRTDCVRSYGYLKAAELKPDMIITLDDDCMPDSDQGIEFVAEHWRRLSEPAHGDAWRSTLGGADPRGMPYQQRRRESRCVLNHGLWTGVPDFDAATQLLATRIPIQCQPIDQVIPTGFYFPMCGMNLAFRPELVPALYFMLMGRDHPYDRFGDIWAGLFVKKIVDHLGMAVTSGRPVIRHERASNVWANLRKEAPGLEVNETLWQWIDSVILTATGIADCYRQLADQALPAGDYWSSLRQAMNVWTDLCEERLALVPHSVNAFRDNPPTSRAA